MKISHQALLPVIVALTTIFGGCLLNAEAATFRKLRTINENRPRYVTVGDPAHSVIHPGTGFDGVVDLVIKTDLETFGCSGSLLTSGRHILTAAHCFTDGSQNIIANSIQAFFDLPTGSTSIKSANLFIHSDWTDDFSIINGDIAIIELASEAPLAAERYNIYRNTDEVGKIGIKVGYGYSGNGHEGGVSWDGLKRLGKNIYDAPGEILSTLPELDTFPGASAVLAYDFDNGLSANDAFGVHFSLSDTGLGLDEINSAPGDSGGPTFINGLIAGITSFGVCYGYPDCSGSDIDNILNSSFGEFSGDTRVSTYANWIDSILSRPATVPEPSTIGALLLAGFAALRYRKKL
ncbi:trypsin-like serine protease [Scytonema sp. UIC 10036]|uniref:trypsin-like serine protease n=1 Tax=Scytonema sp. UIC 10036 TaxID=2304196 RepID=UPI0012DA4528|nr:trypsin-like serine protease [Scytonema sp. UIC 10036]MUG91527.1 trypsin-like serine protease [Scytonema sp. UIC 10036]